MLKTCRYVDAKIREVLRMNIKLLNDIGSLSAEKLPAQSQQALYRLYDTLFNSKSFEGIKAVQRKYQILFDIESQIGNTLEAESEKLLEVISSEGMTFDVLKQAYYSTIYNFIKQLYVNFPDVSRQPLFEMQEYAALQRGYMLLAAKSPGFLEESMSAFYGKMNKL